MPGGTRQNDGLGTGIMGRYGSEISVACWFTSLAQVRWGGRVGGRVAAAGLARVHEYDVAFSEAGHPLRVSCGSGPATLSGIY